MPLFRTKFQPKKSAPRRSTAASNLRRSLDPIQIEQYFGLQVDRIRLELGPNRQMEFDMARGRWDVQSPTPSGRAVDADAQAEADLLRVQVQVLLDMLTETALEAHLEPRSGAGAKKKSSRKLFD